MSLRLLAEQDLGGIVEDSQTGFGWPITLIDPTGKEGAFTGLSDDIAQIIDPDTGQAVSGRLASVAIRISKLYEQGFTLPEHISDESSAPWLVRFNDINGLPYTFKIVQPDPDRAIGLVVCLLSSYK